MARAPLAPQTVLSFWCISRRLASAVRPAALYLLDHGANALLLFECDRLTPTQAASEMGLIASRLRLLTNEVPRRQSLEFFSHHGVTVRRQCNLLRAGSRAMPMDS